jgi:hypothetical protein
LAVAAFLLDQSRVLLRHLVHLGQRLVDLLDAGGLLDAGAGDVGDQIGNFLDRLDDLAQRLASLVDQIDAGADLAVAAGDAARAWGGR